MKVIGFIMLDFITNLFTVDQSESIHAVHNFQESRIEVVLLTGDNETVGKNC